MEYYSVYQRLVITAGAFAGARGDSSSTMFGLEIKQHVQTGQLIKVARFCDTACSMYRQLSLEHVFKHACTTNHTVLLQYTFTIMLYCWSVAGVLSDIYAQCEHA